MNSKNFNFFDILPIILFIVSSVNLFICPFCGYVSLVIAVLIAIWVIVNIKKKDLLYFICLGLSVLSIAIFVCVNIFGLLGVSNKLSLSNSNKFVNVASNVVASAKDDYIYHKYKDTKCYTLSKINELKLLKTDLVYSPDNVKFSDTSFVKVFTDENGVVASSICLIDVNNNGFNYIDQVNINKKSLKVGSAEVCVLPSECQ